MRINPSIMNQNARLLVQERTAQDRSLICVYLAGSLLEEDSRLGGAADIDLVFVHAYPVPQMGRELVRLSDEIHFDIVHRLQEDYNDPRSLRRQPWLGSDLWRKPTVFFEKNHWFDFVLAGTFSQFDSPENSLWRAQGALQNARQQVLAAYSEDDSAHDRLRFRYLRAVEEGANALALLDSTPISTRRLLVDFPKRAAAMDAPEWTARLIAQFAQELPNREQIFGWIEPWTVGYHNLNAQGNAPLELHSLREAYYRQAMTALLDDLPVASLWILLRTWAVMPLHGALPAESSDAFSELLHMVGLADEQLEERFEGLDRWLDEIAEIFDDLSTSVGLSPMSEWEPNGIPADAAHWESYWAHMGVA